jgi:hypothetical protein
MNVLTNPPAAGPASSHALGVPPRLPLRSDGSRLMALSVSSLRLEVLGGSEADGSLRRVSSYRSSASSIVAPFCVDLSRSSHGPFAENTPAKSAT